MIYLLTAIGLPPGGSSTVRIYTQTVHRTTQNKQYKEQHKKWAGYNAVVTYVRIVQRFRVHVELYSTSIVPHLHGTVLH